MLKNEIMLIKHKINLSTEILLNNLINEKVNLKI